MNGTTVERVQGVARDQLRIGDVPAPASRVYADLAADSLDGVELLLALEEEFRVEISDVEWESLGKDPTLTDIAALIDRCLTV
jgi:acyl carrier protein